MSLSCVRGEQMLSCQRHGVALTICELGNGTWIVLFPDRARFLPRETVACQALLNIASPV